MKHTLRFTVFGLLVFMLMSPTGMTHAEEASRVYAVIIANNHSLDRDFAALRFADDDGAKYFELFRAAGADVVLLTVLDPDAQRRFPQAAKAAIPPYKREVLNSVNRFFKQIESDNAAGITTHFVFIYSGHGNLGPNQEGYINLQDARFHRSELYRDILARSPATFNHLILDACHSYFLVNKKGRTKDKQGNYRALVKDFLKTEELGNYPNTGVILAASSESETHEWSKWEAGIFSHELRSALLGAADVNGNGQVTYAEAAACVEAANAAIDVPKAQIKVYYKPPARDVDVPLLDLRRLSSQTRLRIEPAMANRYFIEDARGIRIADFNFTPEQPIEVALVGEGPFFLKTINREASIEDNFDKIHASNLEFKVLSATSKGSVERSFRRHLYEVPYGMGFFRGALTALERDEENPFNTGPSGITRDTQDGPFQKISTWGWISLGAGVLGGVASGIFYYASDQSYERYKAANEPSVARKNRETTEERLLTSRILLGSASALVLTGATLLLLDAMGVGKDSSSDGVLEAQIDDGVVMKINRRW